VDRQNGSADKHSYPGTRSTPTVDGDRIYHEGSDGDVACFDAKTGKIRWTRNILTAFGGKAPRWGVTESPLVDGRRVFVSTLVPGSHSASNWMPQEESSKSGRPGSPPRWTTITAALC